MSTNTEWRGRKSLITQKDSSMADHPALRNDSTKPDGVWEGMC